MWDLFIQKAFANPLIATAQVYILSLDRCNLVLP